MKTNRKFKIIFTFSPIFTESPLPYGIDTTVGCIKEWGHWVISMETNEQSFVLSIHFHTGLHGAAWLFPPILPGRPQALFCLTPHRYRCHLRQSGDTARHWTRCRGGESGSGQATEGWLTHQSHSSQYVQGAWGRNFSLSFFVCVCACLRAHVHMCVLLHMCGYMCQSLRPIIMLNCFSSLFTGAGSPNQT